MEFMLQSVSSLFRATTLWSGRKWFGTHNCTKYLSLV